MKQINLNSITSNLTYLLTGNNSEEQVKDLKPYLNAFIISLIVTASVKIIKLLLIF